MVPDMGLFIAEEIPSCIQYENKIITPPDRKILFCTSEKEDDGVLISAYSNRLSISKEAARKVIERYINDIKSEIVNCGEVVLPNFGTFNKGIGGDFHFYPNIDLSGHFPLEPLSIMPKKKKSKRAEEAVESITSVEEKSVVVVEELGEAFDFSDIMEAVQQYEQVQTEEKQVAVEVEAPEEINQEEVTLEVISQEETASEEISQEESASEELNQEEIASEELNKEEVTLEEFNQGDVASEEMSEQERDLSEMVNSGEKIVGSFNRVVTTILIILGALILICILIYIFRDALRPFLEIVLYNKEDREILKMMQ